MRLFLLFTATLFFLPSYALAQDYLWPTNSGNYLSSTFGETRSAHFHAGLDIKTWGREGYEVYASRDGKLYRLLVTERGYGNAIYLKHPDSTFTVYAHLQRFNDTFTAIADSIRFQDYSFEMDAVLESMDVKVSKGDVIGYTGSTGIGPPHLHFEVRDQHQNPVNALTTNLRIRDDLPPVFSSLIVEPLTKNSLIEGKPVSYYTRDQKKGDGLYDFGEIRISGKAGLAVNVFDPANNVNNAYAVYSLALMSEQDTLFYEELNTFSFNESEEMFLDRIAPFGSTRRGHQRLYKKDGSQNPFYLIFENAEIEVPDSSQTYSIIAEDYFGNTSRAKLTLTPAPVSSAPSTQPRLHPKDWYWSENWASPDLRSTLDLTQNDLGFRWTKHHQIASLEFGETNFIRILPDSQYTVTSADRRLRLRFPSHTFFDTLTIAASYTEGPGGEITISVQPQMLASKSGFGLQFFMGENFNSGQNYRLFQVDPDDGDLKYVHSMLVGKTVHAYPSQLGEFVIRADNEPPKLSEFRIFRTDYGKWLATMKATDDQTEIESSSAFFEINGIRGIAEYDYEEELLIYYLPDFTPKDVNNVRIRIKDKAGNSTERSFRYPFSGSQ